jgi:hypothetical protein
MTSEVMVVVIGRPYGKHMKKMLPLLVLVPFTVFSTWVVVRHGYFGFVTLAMKEPWALQMLVDLCISLAMVGTWLRRDARHHGIAATPYLMLLPFAGSVAALGYLIHRAYRSPITKAGVVSNFSAAET